MIKTNKEEIISVSHLINDLTDEKDSQKRILALGSLKKIGHALGPIRVRNELIPHLKEEIVNDDDSEVIISMLDSLVSLGESMGGGLEYTYLLPLIEEVLQNEEEKVRRKAVETYEKIVKESNVQKCEAKILISIKNILAFDFLEAKQAFVLIASKMLGNFSNPNHQFLLNQYLNFAESPNIILRRYASMYSKYLVEWLTDFEAPILKIVEVLFKDKDESNKIYLVDTIISLSKFKNNVFLQAYFNMISYQFPWRIRYELISKVDKLAQVLGTREKFKPFLTYMVKYINDIEPEIRSISCLKLREIVTFVDPDDVINKIIPAIKSIPSDSHPYVRNSLAKSLLSLCQIIGKKNTSEHILPKFLQLLKDEEIEVQLTIFSCINEICEVLGVDTLSQTTVPAIADLSKHSKWRVRAASCDILFYLIQKSGKDFVNEKIIKQIMDYIFDNANAVRKEGIKLLAKIQVELGSEWFEKSIMPRIVQLSKATGYMKRETFLEAIEALSPKLSPEYMNKNINQILYSTIVADQVDNVKLTLCKVLKPISENHPKDKEQIKKTLRVLSEDKDRDVREMASKTLKQV